MNNQLKDLTEFIDAIPNALIIVDEKKIIRLLNHHAALLFSYAKKDLINQEIEIVLNEKAQEQFSVFYAKYRASVQLAESQNFYCELMGLKQNTTEFPLELSLGLWSKKNQELLTIICIKDLSHHKQLCTTSEELEQSNQTKNQFLATMSHQLRTPLNAVLGFSEILLLKLAGDLTKEQEKQINIIHKSGKHLLALINDLSDLAKIDAHEVTFCIEDFNLPELLFDIVNSLTPFAEEKKLQLINQVPDIELLVRSDKRLLTQIITNIVHNAIKFTEKGSICLRREETKTKFILHIIDTGNGIKAEKIELLFQAFQQLFIAEKKQDGSGLGLHISKKLADLIGVDLAVSSEYSKGTHFSISIAKTRK